jgi:putative hydrolase of the HAD superfamily
MTASGIRGLLVDWGGVMTTDVFAAFTTFCAQEGISPDAVAQRFASDPDAAKLLVGLETGAISEQQFEPRLAELLGVDGHGLIDRLFASGADDPVMHDAVARARAAGIRTGLISNSWGTGRYDRELLARLFDGVVISGEVGIRKPSARIYELGAEAIGLAPDECVFVDDLGMNLGPAAKMGMATVHHTNAQQTISELEALLSVALR